MHALPAVVGDSAPVRNAPPVCTPILTSGATISASSARWIATAASIAAFGLSNDAKKPSPVCLITSPPLSTIRSRTSSSWRASSFFHFSSPSVSSSSRRVDDVGEEERSARLELAEELVARAPRRASRPSRSNVASAASSSAVAACSSPWRAERDPEQHPRLRRLVRRADLLPLVARALQATDRSVRVALGELDPAVREVDGRVERRRPAAADLVRVDDLLELVRRGARRLQVAGRDRDLDLRGQAPQPRQSGSWASSSARRDPRDRGVDLALGETQEREARLRVAARARSAVRYASSAAGEVAAATADLADLVVAARR